MNLIFGLFTLALSVSVVRAAESETITISVTPNAYYSVSIDTANVGLDLGTVDMSASTQTVQPATVTVNSTFAQTDLQLRGTISSGGTAWSFDTNTATQETDSLAGWAVFTTVDRTSAPAQSGDYFSGTTPAADGSDVIRNTNKYVGSSATDGNNMFENNSDFDAKDMDGLAPDPDPAAKSHLWFLFRLPNATTSNTSQEITINVTAGAPN